jgi:hypothetical protein
VQIEPPVVTIGHAIQLAVAPVFLLTGISSLLAVLTNRLSRIIDRSRTLGEPTTRIAGAEQASLDAELRLLSRRARLINSAVRMCTIGALLICAVIVTLFVGAFLSADVSVIVGISFTAGMLALCWGLVSFLREIHLATRTLRIGPP